MLSKADPSKLCRRRGLFNKPKKQIVERIPGSGLEHDLGYSKHTKIIKSENDFRTTAVMKNRL